MTLIIDKGFSVTESHEGGPISGIMNMCDVSGGSK
jgi:hypothetical protein